MKTVMVTAPSSMQGKTTFTMGLVRALKRRGLDVSPFKTGPDFIDPKFHAYAAGKSHGNLDLHMQGEEGLKIALSLNSGDYAVIEGAMGYFDGIDNSYIGSSFDISRKVDCKAILVASPGAQMFSLIPKLMGMEAFSEKRLSMIVLNQVSQKYYEKIKPQIEKYTSMKVLGYLPKKEDMSLKHRHLGLVGPDEIEGIDEYLDSLAVMLEEYIDIDLILENMSDIKLRDIDIKKTDKKVLIAKDKVFSFHYNENLKLLDKACNLSFFSPLEDESLPYADLIIIAGGYPELYLEKLEKNQKMKEALVNYHKSGGKILAFGAGLIYLSEEIDGHKMVGLLKGKSKMTEKTVRFGYNEITCKEDSLLGQKGKTIKAKEFHKSVFESDLEKAFVAKKIDGSSWNTGYVLDNLTAIFQHINLVGNLYLLESLLK